MKVPDSRLSFSMTLLRSITRAQIGELAQVCGMALTDIAHPLATIISIKLTNLDPEDYFDGPDRYRSILESTLKAHDLSSPGKNETMNQAPSFIAIATDDGKMISVSTIKHLGELIGYVAAISDNSTDEVLPLSEVVWLTASQLGIRIHTILSPNGPLSAELTGRQLLQELQGDGVRALTIGSVSGGGAWITLNRIGNKTEVREIERLPQEQVASISDGEIIGENTLRYFWSNSEIPSGLWVSVDSGFYLAVGFEDRKLLNPRVVNRVKEHFEKKARNDAAYIIKAFEKLKADFKQLVKSERAAAITETAVTVNHEINNPLTAILGNTQLMLMSKDKLPADIVAKLETIERSAVKIRETTSQLMSIIEPVTSPYASGLEMIDIEKSKKKKAQ
jgi:hypothetical protein